MSHEGKMVLPNIDKADSQRAAVPDGENAVLRAAISVRKHAAEAAVPERAPGTPTVASR
jgi:hypothetical protein